MELMLSEKQQLVDRLLDDDVFLRRFARHVNDYFNDSVANEKTKVVYSLAYKILKENRSWHEMFNGSWRMNADNNETDRPVQFSSDNNALGYLSDQQWEILYEGGEGEGFQLRKAYRIAHNMVGLRLPPVDAQAADRRDPQSACFSCHFEPKNVFALDLIAQALPKKDFIDGMPISGQFVQPTFDNESDAPDVLGRVDVKSTAEVVSILLSEEFRNDFNFNACRMVFNFFYHRDEANNVVDYKQFDACMQQLEESKQPSNNLKAAIKGFLMTPEFCRYQ